MGICDYKHLPISSVKALFFIGATGFAFYPGASLGFDWRVTPSLSASEIFSDNLNLSEDDKEAGLVSEISPALSLYGSSPWSSFNLSYRLQGLYNAGGRDALDINNQLSMNSVYQAVKNTLFLETASSITQQNISNSFVTTDNVSGNGQRTEVKTFSISPYWTPYFGHYANGLVKVGYNRTSFDNSNTPIASSVNNFISDSETFSRQARLTSGSEFNRVSWGLNYSSQEQTRVSDQDVRFEQYQGDARYYVNQKFSVFGVAGYENNDYQTTSNINNGFFYTVGARWNPSRWYSLEAGYGNNKHATLEFNPSANLSSTITYRDKSVGLNTGSSWDASLNYRVQQASVGFSYTQETTTLQQLLTEQGFFRRDASGNLVQLSTNDLISQNILTPQGIDSSGNLVLGRGPNFSQLVVNPFDLVNDVIIRKRGNLSFSYQTGKSSYNASVFNERRTYELRTGEDLMYGVTGGWQWQFQPRLSFYLQPSWMHTDSELFSNTRYDVSLGLSRAIPINLGRPLMMNTRLELRHINQTTEGSQTSGGYIENRATANFNVQF